MKSTLDMRPVLHWAPHRSHAHVAITVLPLLLERTVEHACGDTWRNVSDRLRRIQLAQLLSPRATVWQVTGLTPEAAKCLKSLQIKSPPPIIALAGYGQTPWLHGRPACGRKVVVQCGLTWACHV